MSKCWKCNKEFYGENLSQILCDECLKRIPKTTATTDFVNLLHIEMYELKISDLETKLAEKEKEIEKLNACVDFYKSYYISFKGKVIDELEKVKSVINASVRDDHILWDFDIKAHIDNQINVLRNNKDGIH